MSNGPDQVFNINARGQLAVTGTIIIKNDSFAGSMATDINGMAEVDFAYDLGSGKPVIELTPEAVDPVFAQVVGWKKDPSGNYIGFQIKTFNLSGAAVSTVVHYLVIGKQDGYATNGEPVLQVAAPAPAPAVAGDSTADPGTASTTPDAVLPPDPAPAPADPAASAAPADSTQTAPDASIAQ